MRKRFEETGWFQPLFARGVGYGTFAAVLFIILGYNCILVAAKLLRLHIQRLQKSAGGIFKIDPCTGHKSGGIDNIREGAKFSLRGVTPERFLSSESDDLLGIDLVICIIGFVLNTIHT